MGTLSSVSQGRITVGSGTTSVVRYTRTVGRRYINGVNGFNILTPFPDGTAHTGPQITSSSGMWQRLRFAPTDTASHIALAFARTLSGRVPVGASVTVTARGVGANELLGTFQGRYVTASPQGVVVDMQRTNLPGGGNGFDFNDVLGRRNNAVAADFWGIYYELEVGDGCVIFQTACINVPNITDNTFTSSSSQSNRQLLIVDNNDNNRIERIDFNHVVAAGTPYIDEFSVGAVTGNGTRPVTLRRNGQTEFLPAFTLPVDATITGLSLDNSITGVNRIRAARNNSANDLTVDIPISTVEISGQTYVGSRTNTALPFDTNLEPTLTEVAIGDAIAISNIDFDDNFRLRRDSSSTNNFFVELNPFSEYNRTSRVRQINQFTDANDLPGTTILSFGQGLQTIQWGENITASVVTPAPTIESFAMQIDVDKSPELFTATAGTGAAGFTETSHTTSSNDRDGLFFNAADFSISQETVGGTATNVISATASAGGVGMNSQGFTAAQTGGVGDFIATIQHNLNNQHPVVTVYDNTNNVILPMTIVGTNTNTLTLTFPSAVNGTVTCVG